MPLPQLSHVLATGGAFAEQGETPPSACALSDTRMHPHTHTPAHSVVQTALVASAWVGGKYRLSHLCQTLLDTPCANYPLSTHICHHLAHTDCVLGRCAEHRFRKLNTNYRRWRQHEELPVGLWFCGEFALISELLVFVLKPGPRVQLLLKRVGTGYPASQHPVQTLSEPPVVTFHVSGQPPSRLGHLCKCHLNPGSPTEYSVRSG